jgi:hypothetical protein
MTSASIANISWAVIAIAATVLTHFGILPQNITDIIYGFAGYQGSIAAYKATTNGLISLSALKQSNASTTPPKEN